MPYARAQAVSAVAGVARLPNGVTIFLIGFDVGAHLDCFALLVNSRVKHTSASLHTIGNIAPASLFFSSFPPLSFFFSFFFFLLLIGLCPRAALLW